MCAATTAIGVLFRAGSGSVALAIGLSLCLAGAALGRAHDRRGNFSVEKIAGGVYAFIRTEPPSLWFNPNNVLVVGNKDVTIVDSNISSEYTREVLAAIRRITDKPVRYVVNTHWHEDHIIGNQVYREAFPDVQFVGHRSTLTDLPTVGAENRKNSVENGKGFVDLLSRNIANGNNVAGQTLTEEERTGYESDIKLVSSYLAEAAHIKVVLPTVPVDDRLVISDGQRRIEILHLGRAHTGADLVVHLPKEKIVITGDLVVFPVPLIGSTSYPLEYAATVKKLRRLDAKLWVPGHGPVMRDDRYIQQVIDLLSSIERQAKASFGRGESLDQMRKRIDIGAHRKAFAGDSQHKSLIFQNYVFLPATAAAFRQLQAREVTR